MNRKGDFPYVDCNVDREAHAKWILSQIGPYASEVRDDSGGDSDGSNDSGDDSCYDSGDDSGYDSCDDSGVKYLFGRLPKSRRMKLKYVRQKSGGGCGSGKRFVPVSCSKNCPKCHGCSPGCGKNYEFEQVDDFFLDSKTWDRLWNQFENNQDVDYIICSNLTKMKE